MKMISTIFASSDGWMPRPPMFSQRVAPLIGRPKSTATSKTATIAESCPDDDRLPIVAVVDPHHELDEAQPEQRKRRLLEEKQVRVVVAVHRHDGRRAVHHDHAGADEQQRGGEQQFV